MSKVGGYTELSTVANTLDILNLLSFQKEPVSTQTVADEMDTTYTTAKNYLVTMERKQFVRQVSGRWELGSAASLLWARRKAALGAAINKAQEELEDV